MIRKNARIKVARSFCNAGRRCISFRFLRSRTSGYCYLLRRRHFPLACRRYVVPGLCKMADVPMSPHINVPKGGKFFHTGISISDSTSHECIAMHLLVPCVGSRRKYSSTDTRIFDLQVPVFRLASPLSRHSKLLRSVKQSSFSDCSSRMTICTWCSDTFLPLRISIAGISTLTSLLQVAIDIFEYQYTSIPVHQCTSFTRAIVQADIIHWPADQASRNSENMSTTWKRNPLILLILPLPRSRVAASRMMRSATAGLAQ